MAFTPSIRECLVQLDRMADTPAIADEIAAFAIHELGGGCEDLSAAHRRLRDLHQLAHHMAHYVRGGSASPAAPVRQANKGPQTSPIHVAPTRALPIPEGWVGTDEFMERLGKSKVSFYNAISSGKVPKPEKKLGLRSMWQRATVDACVAKHKASKVAA